jgi:hypothetical protein
MQAYHFMREEHASGITRLLRCSGHQFAVDSMRAPRFGFFECVHGPEACGKRTTPGCRLDGEMKWPTRDC